MLQKVSEKYWTMNNTTVDLKPPQNPLSAYAFFFKETQASIKSSTPDATFEAVSKIVEQMWQSLEENQKDKYRSSLYTSGRIFSINILGLPFNRVKLYHLMTSSNNKKIEPSSGPNSFRASWKTFSRFSESTLCTSTSSMAKMGLWSDCLSSARPYLETNIN